MALDKHMSVMMACEEFSTGPGAAQMFGNAGREHAR
jgi:hypothetical protein